VPPAASIASASVIAVVRSAKEYRLVIAASIE
jgi:hypothetical protein